MACSQAPGGLGGYKIAFVPSISGQYGIFAMNSDTTGLKLLAADEMAQLRFASWSPDGKKIAFFTARARDANILQEYRMPNQYLLYVMDATGGNQKRLLDFPVLDFAWAPDSRRLLFISAHESPDRNSPEVLSATNNPLASVYVLDLQTGGKTRLAGSGRNCSASWSPDGTRLAVSFGDAENGGIYLMSADGQHSSHLTDASTIDCRPKWSPDGKSVAYVAYPKTEADAKDAGVFVIAADGTSKKRVTAEEVYYVRWSPDGSMLLLQFANGVRLVDLVRKKQVLLSAGLRREVNAIFTPDGKGVMYCSDDEGAWNIYSIGPDGQKRKKITGRTNSSNFCLSPLLTSH
jgi:TolB protein